MKPYQVLIWTIRKIRQIIRQIQNFAIESLIIWYSLQWLRRKGVLQADVIKIPAYHGVVLKGDKIICKVAFNHKSTIKTEKLNYRKAIETYPGLTSICCTATEVRIPYIHSFCLKKLKPIQEKEAISFAVDLYNRMEKFQSKQGIRGISQFVELEIGLKIVQNHLDKASFQILSHRLEDHLLSTSYLLGFVHGDFHSGNIMIDNSNKPHLIDFDCIKLEGIKVLDPVYFILESEWRKTGVVWYDTIINCLSGRKSIEQELLKFNVIFDPTLLIISLLYRIGQETLTYKSVYPRRMIKESFYKYLTLDIQIDKIINK